jgi:hypothetical protein
MPPRLATPRLAKAACAILALAGGVVLSASPSYADSPYSHRGRLAVSPSNQLSSGTQITFAGSGFPTGLALRLEECDPDGPLTDSRCTAIADSLFLTSGDGSVSGSATIVSGTVGSSGSGATAAAGNCPVSREQAAHGQGCLVVLEAVDQSGWYGAAPIGFAPSVPVPADPPPRTTTSNPPATAPSAPARQARADANGTDLVDARGPAVGAGTAGAAGRGGPFGWPVWGALMAGAAAGTGALRAARTRRSRPRDQVPPRR